MNMKILSGRAGCNQAFYFRTYKKKPDVPKNKLILCAFAQVFFSQYLSRIIEPHVAFWYLATASHTQN
jgi:hypothetical protein